MSLNTDLTAINAMNDDDVDQEIQQSVFENTSVKAFLDAIQTTVITESIEITPKMFFYLSIFLFLLPSAWSVYSILAVDLPKRLYFDGCFSKETGEDISLSRCFFCANNRTALHLELVTIPDKTRILQAVSVSVAVLVAILSCAAYARLTLAEYLAIHLLGFGVIVRSPMTCDQVLPVIVFAVLFAVVGVLVVFSQASMSNVVQNIVVGYNDICDPSSADAGKVFIAKFNDDNVSIAASSSPTNALSYIKAFAVVFLPFVPLLLRVWRAATSTFQNVSLEHLTADSTRSADVFRCMRWSVDEKDLMDAVTRFANSIEDDESVGRFVRRIVSCSWSMGKPIPDYFGFAWGTSLRSAHKVLTMVFREGKLTPYRVDETVSKVAAKKVGAAGGAAGGPVGVAGMIDLPVPQPAGVPPLAAAPVAAPEGVGMIDIPVPRAVDPDAEML